MEWARRLCSANRHYVSRVLIGSQTHQLAEGELEVRPLELVQRHPEDRHREEIYELLSPKNALSEEELRAGISSGKGSSTTANAAGKRRVRISSWLRRKAAISRWSTICTGWISSVAASRSWSGRRCRVKRNE